jgi:FkbM family methyltransferase
MVFSLYQKYYGLFRSFILYYGIPFRGRRLARFYRQFVKPGDLCFDIGAHVGNHLQAFLSLGARVVAVEPQKDLMTFLQWKFGRNDNVSLLEKGVGPLPGVFPIFVSRRTPTVSTFSREWMQGVFRTTSFSRVDWDIVQMVEMVTLDELIARYGEPAFCKIDVEGYENEVLQGLSRPLIALSFEYTPALPGMAVSAINRLTALSDYRFNWTSGENRKFLLTDWVEAGEMVARLASLSPVARPGDIYACRERS